MKTITIDSRNFLVPECWNELTPEQLRFLARITLKNVPIQDIRLKMALFCMGGKVSGYKKNGRYKISFPSLVFEISPEAVIPITECFGFLFSVPDIDGNCYIDSRLTRNPFPVLKFHLRKLIGPADALTDISYEQFILLQTFAERMSVDPLALDAFIGIIYKRKSGKEASRFIRRLPPDIKIVIFWLYTGTLRFIAEKYPRVFSGTGELSNDTAFESQQKIIHSLANGELTKKDHVRHSLLYDALFTMELNIEQHEELESNIRS